MRKLVTYRTISDVWEHPNADRLDIVVIDGWQVVTQRGNFQKGDPCCFFEIDSFLPVDDPRFEFLSKTGVKKDASGQQRVRLRTIKLRGEISQGLALPWNQFHEFHERTDLDQIDMAQVLNVIKYQRPFPTVTNAAGSFPDTTPKTDEERIQNIHEEYSNLYHDDLFVPTLKLDGSSCTVLPVQDPDNWKNTDSVITNAINVRDHRGDKVAEVAVCSRNLQLKVDAESHFWKATAPEITDYPNPDVVAAVIHELTENNRSLAIQGEVIGPGIQKNPEKLNNFKFYVFNIYDIRDGHYLNWQQVTELCDEHNLNHVPAIDEPHKPFSDFDLNQLLKYSDGPSLNNKRREGIVWKKCDDGDVSFKVISNAFLLSGGDD